MIVGAILLALAQAADTAAPSPSPSPLKTIIRVKTTPFCDVFRENVFRAVQGLRINDDVIDEGQSVLAKWVYDSVVEGGKLNGPSVKMDQYHLGQVAYQAGHNLQRVYALLNDPNRFPTTPQNDADRELLKMKGTLTAVVEAQERSLNIISGTYETAALYSLLSLGNNTAGALQQGSVADKNLELGDPVFTAPGYITPPTTASSAHASLFGSTPVGRIHSGIVISQRITGIVESQVADAIKPGIERCARQ